MKGRRKIKDPKWALQVQFEGEAHRLLANRSKKAEHRFLNAITPFVIDEEPAGWLAGGLRNPAVGSITE